MSQFTLKEVIRQTIFSIADNDHNKLMTGELFEIEENDLKVVSLDGHRISIRNIELKNNYSHKKVVVPGKTLQEVSKILPGSAEDEVSIFLTDNHIVFEFENTTVVSRLIEGEYLSLIHIFRPFKNARFVNSPGSAGRAPYLITVSSTRFMTYTPP